MECTGISAVNGDLTNTINWTALKAAGTPTLGAIIKRNNAASYQICTTAGTLGAAEPSFSDTAGVTTTETSATTVWTSLGAVGSFTGGQAPHARLANACANTWFAAANTVYVGDNHAESQATTMTISAAGSLTTIGRILCHNHSGPYPPTSSDLMTGASVSTTGNVLLTYAPSGSFYNYGIAFRGGVGVAGSAGSFLTLSTGQPSSLFYFDRCSLEIAATVSGSYLLVGSGSTVSCTTIFNNTTTKFANIGQFVTIVLGQFIWQNTAAVLASGSSVPAVFFQRVFSGTIQNIILEALDLNQLTGAIYGAAQAEVGSFLIKDCKLNAAATITTPATTGQVVQLVRSDSGATGYKSARYQYEGTETTETSITRVGGAADPTGQAQSRKIVTAANSQWLRPFKAEPYAIWNAVTGANVTVTVCGTINAGALPNNDDIWLEVEYLGSSATPLGTIVTTTKSNLLASNAAVSSDSSTWNGGGSGAGWSPFKLTTTLSSPQPGLAGYIHARVRAAKPSTTFYLDPQITLT